VAQRGNARAVLEQVAALMGDGMADIRASPCATDQLTPVVAVPGRAAQVGPDRPAA
jgi:hypothetical protein